jgi:hypothetical protein
VSHIAGVTPLSLHIGIKLRMRRIWISHVHYEIHAFSPP